MSYATIDFETWGIENRPEYPPAPCGVAIKVGHRLKYYSWAHERENNCTEREAIRALRDVWYDNELIFHNAAFDIEVAMQHLGFSWPERYHDTLILAYLHDPREASLGLKVLADKYLDMPPEEQTQLKDWIIGNVAPASRAKSTWGAYIQSAPGRLVAPYAKGDVVRTWKLFKFLYAKIKSPDNGGVYQSMLPAYHRELRLLRTKINMERSGIRGDTQKLKAELPAYQSCLVDVERGIRRKLKITKRWETENCTDGVFNVNSGPQLGKALDHAGLVGSWIMTPKGNRSTSRGNLEQCVSDAHLVDLLALQGILTNYIGTFLTPWLTSCEASDGYIYPSFNTVRSSNEYGSGGVGTRTGRLSSSNPNFQNIPASVKGSVHERHLRRLQTRLKQYGVNLVGLRDYLIPDEGCVFLNRDYSQQEFRILAHFEDGALLKRYLENPKIDAHTLVQAMVKESTGREYPRKAIKNVNFGIVYGMGVALLAKGIGCSIEEASLLKGIILEQVPGIRMLNRELKIMARHRQPLITYGGRHYQCEPDKLIGGAWRSFEYKQLNTLIQGSAADCTKQAMIQVEDNLTTGRLVLQVHDELMVCAPIGDAKKEMGKMREAMEDMQFDIPMITDGKAGLGCESWARMKTYEE